MSSSEIKAEIKGAYGSAKEIANSRKAHRISKRLSKEGAAEEQRPRLAIESHKEEAPHPLTGEAAKPVEVSYEKVRTKESRGMPRKMRLTQNPPNRQQW